MTYHHVAACKCASQGIHEDCLANTLVAVALPTIVPAFQLGEEWTASEGHTGSYAVTVSTTNVRSSIPPPGVPPDEFLATAREVCLGMGEVGKIHFDQGVKRVAAALRETFEDGRAFEAEARGGSST